MAHTADDYYVPHGSYWPILGSIGLTTLLVGFAMYLNQSGVGGYLMLGGVAITLVMMFGWFGTVINENQSGIYNAQVDRSFRWGMFWFIVSEVMFFGGFFGALFYAREFSVPWLAGEGAKLATGEYLWKGYEAVWPTNGPKDVGGEFEPMETWGLPALNTLILLSSGATLTWAHHALKSGHRGKLIIGLALTVALGALFLFFQAMEYREAYTHLNLTLGSGIYGSTFFMLTGFHGMHVTIGAIMLLVMLMRALKGHFTPDNHFAFEAAAWYWHFVDVVWLLLFIFVYWL
ncbi:MAG TPA: cytochrome c oxidase subunit 3 [Gammaproteobacteria bacterium]|nr:cytochrome c oxidase subunit 3 [Gammaproteobacteria bacterium]